MKVYIAGEDIVTREICKRILSCVAPSCTVISELPVRGGEIKAKIPQFNNLSQVYPVIFLMDLDAASCAPELINQWLPNGKNENFIFNIAVDEGEAWLFADRKGFADYFFIPINELPLSRKTKQNGNTKRDEMDIPLKSSLYLTSQLVPKSTSFEIQMQLTPKTRASKGPEYNSCVVPFIQHTWNIDAARKNSDSLDRMIRRITNLVKGS